MNNNSILDFYDNESKMLCRINKEGDKLIVAEWHSKEEKWVPKKFNQPFQMICITLLKSRAISGQNEEKLNENSEVEKKECENTGEKTLNNQEAISLSGIIVKLKEKLSLQSLLVIIKGHYYIYIGTKEKPENTFLYQYLKSDQEQGQWQWINTLSNNELNLKKIEEKAKEKWAQYIEAPYEEIEKFYFKPIYFVEKGHFKLKPDNIYLMSTTIKSEDSKVMYLFTTLTSAIEENRFEAKFSPEETVNNNKKMQWGWREENILALPSLYVLKAERIKKDLPISFKKDYILIVLVQYNGKNYIAINGKQIIEPKENNLYLSFDINSKLIIEKNNLTLNALENIIRDFECRHENDYNNYLKSIDNNLLSKIVSELKPLCSYDALSDDQDDSNIKCLVFLAYLCHLLDYMLQNEGNKLSNPLSHDYLYEQKEDKKDNNVFYFLNLVTNSQMKLDVLKLEFSINQQFRLYKMDLPSVCYQSNFKLFWEKTNIISYLDGLLAISLLYMDGNYSNQPMSVIGFPCYVQYRFDYLQLSLKENDGYIICFLLFYRLEEERQPYLAIETKRMNNEEYKKESHLFLFYDYISRKFKILTKENSLHQDLTNYMCNAYNYGERFIENPFLKGGPLSLLKKLMQANNLNGNLTKSEKNSLKSIRFLNIVPIEKMKPGKENPHSLFAYDLLKLRFSNNRKSWILKTAVVSYDTVLSWNPIEISDYLKIATPGLKGIPSLLEVNVFQGLPLSLKESGLINGFVLCLIIFLKKDVYFAIPVQRLNTISENSSNYLFLSFQNNALELSNIGTLTKLRLTNYATAITYTYKFLRPTNFKPIEIEKASNEFSKIIYPNQYDFKKVEEPIQSNQNNTDLLKIKKEDAKGFEIGSIDCSEKEKAFEIIEKNTLIKKKINTNDYLKVNNVKVETHDGSYQEHDGYVFLYSDVLCFSYEKNSKIGIYNTFSKKFQATRGDNQQAKKHINDLLSGNLPLQDVQKTLPTKKKYELPGSIYNADAIKSPIKLCYIEEEKAWKKREKNVFIAVNKADYFDAEDIKIGHAIRKQKGTLFFYKNDCYFRYESNNQKMLWNNNQKEENARFAKFAFHSEKFKPVNKEEYLKLERYFEQLLDKNFVKKEEEKEKDHHSINKKEQIKSSDDEYKEKNTLDNEEMYNSEQYNKLKDQLKKQGETLFQIGKKIQAFLNRLSTSNKTKEKEEEIKKFIAETNQAILASKIKENQGPGDINIKQKKPSEWSVDQCISFIQQTNLTKEEILKEFEMSFNNKDLNVKELTFKEVNSFLEEEEFDIKDHLQDIQDGIMEINSDVFNKKDDFKNELCRKDFNKIIKYVAEKLCKELNPLSYKPTPHI